jgi:hypothetical protein
MNHGVTRPPPPPTTHPHTRTHAHTPVRRNRRPTCRTPARTCWCPAATTAWCASGTCATAAAAAAAPCGSRARCSWVSAAAAARGRHGRSGGGGGGMGPRRRQRAACCGRCWGARLCSSTRTRAHAHTHTHTRTHTLSNNSATHSNNARSRLAQHAGHTEGLTHICARGNGTHLISNAKDQTIKLWDVRAALSPAQAAAAARQRPRIPRWDYRWEDWPGGCSVLFGARPGRETKTCLRSACARMCSCRPRRGLCTQLRSLVWSVAPLAARQCTAAACSLRKACCCCLWCVCVCVCVCVRVCACVCVCV